MDTQSLSFNTILTDTDLQRREPENKDMINDHADDLLTIDKNLLAETQIRVNDLFAADLLFPVYLIKAPEESKAPIMGVCGGCTTHYYRDVVQNWQGPGYTICVFRNKMPRPLFHGALLHEIAHCFQPTMPSPWAGLPEDVGLFVVPKENLRPVFGGAYANYKAHQPDFWRLALHTWSRGVDAGFPCDACYLGETWVDSKLMLETLLPEIRQLADDPLWKIGRRPVPRTFEQLFDFDPEDWDKIDIPSVY